MHTAEGQQANPFAINPGWQVRALSGLAGSLTPRERGLEPLTSSNDPAAASAIHGRLSQACSHSKYGA